MTEMPLGSDARPLAVAVVGSGPSAFYAVDALFRTGNLACRVDMFDRLPTPYGLVRGGVAPDHQKIKAVVRIYEGIAEDPRFRFFGNVQIGRDLSVAELETHYDRVLWAHGAESDRPLGVDGEELQGVHSATEFVGWYNAHPDHAPKEFDLQRSERAVVVGNGNVAMDVARVLVRSVEELARTDISERALEVLSASKIREVVVLGRRGPVEAAFSPKEVKEIAKLPGVSVVVDPEQLVLDVEAEARLAEAPRSAQRNVEQLRELAEASPAEGDRIVRFEFLASPMSLSGDDSGAVTGVEVGRNRLEESSGRTRAVPTGDSHSLEAGLVFKAVGYRGVPVPGLPFDDGWGIVPNDEGQVLDARDGAPVAGHYVVGWAKRGPTGLIGTNSPDSKATVERMVGDLSGQTAGAAPDAGGLEALLGERGVRWVGFDDWRRYDAWELEQGQQANRVRHKLDTVEAIVEQMHALR